MHTFDRIAAMATSGMRAQAYRLQIVSENIANADTHGYRRKLVTFENAFDRENGVTRVEIGRVSLDPKPRAEIFNPGHPLADENGYVVMSNVEMLTEFADAREASRSYEAGLEVYREAREMYAALLDILKR